MSTNGTQFMRTYLVAHCAAAAMLLASLAGAAAQEPSKAGCFDIIAGIVDVPPILLNHCNGQTWILMRSGRRPGQAAYRWTPLGIGPEEQPREPESASVSAGKCFTF